MPTTIMFFIVVKCLVTTFNYVGIIFYCCIHHSFNSTRLHFIIRVNKRNIFCPNVFKS